MLSLLDLWNSKSPPPAAQTGAADRSPARHHVTFTCSQRHCQCDIFKANVTCSPCCCPRWSLFFCNSYFLVTTGALTKAVHQPESFQRRECVWRNVYLGSPESSAVIKRQRNLFWCEHQIDGEEFLNDLIQYKCPFKSVFLLLTMSV